MSPQRRAGIAKPAIALAILSLTLALGVLVRLEDPLSTRVIPAEDPFTHMALVRDHLADGSLDPLYDDGRLYPPGMHAVVASVWIYTGMPLEDIFRFGPVLLGGIGIIGIALLLWRCHGPVAAIVGGLAVALAPEVIFRTTMMSPTALDIAVVPFFLLAVLETLRGRLVWAPVVAALSLFFVLAHPWVLAVLVPAMVATVALWIILGGQRSASGPLHALGATAVLASAAAALVLAVTTCWSQCGIGETSASATSQRVDNLAIAAATGALLVAGLAALLRKRIARWHDAKRRTHVGVRLGLSAAIALAIVAVSIPAFQSGMPEYVKLPRMIGMPILLLGATGLVALPFLPTRAAFAGGSLAVVTYPFVIYNPLDSIFWPHRTAVYLTIGLAILAGIGASAIVAAVRMVVAKLPMPRIRTKRAGRGIARRVTLAGAAGLVATTMLAGSVYAQTPLAYETGWYRLYPTCEYDGLQEIAGQAGPDTVVITGDWRPKLVMAAFASDADDIWYDRQFFADPDKREGTVSGLDQAGRDVIVVLDRHMRVEQPHTNTSFLHEGGWTEMGGWCADGAPGERLNAYTTRGQL